MLASWARWNEEWASWLGELRRIWTNSTSLCLLRVRVGCFGLVKIHARCFTFCQSEFSWKPFLGCTSFYPTLAFGISGNSWTKKFWFMGLQVQCSPNFLDKMFSISHSIITLWGFFFPHFIPGNEEVSCKLLPCACIDSVYVILWQ